MTKKFDQVQKEYYKKPETMRFLWQTTNKYIKLKELELLSQIKDLIEPDKNILEIGCGEGANIVNLQSMGLNNNFVGCDFAETKIDFCTSLELKNVEFIQADARNLPFEDNQFDITLARDILHHVNEDRDALIKEALRVIKPGGKLIIIEANGAKLTNYVFASIFAHERGLKDSTKENLEQLVSQYNYEIKAMEPTNFFRFLLHYSLGMPYLSNLKIVCYLLDLLEAAFKKALPEKRWAYWLITINL